MSAGRATWRIAIAAALAGSGIGAAAVLAGKPARPAPVPAIASAKGVPRDKRPPVHARDITIELPAARPRRHLGPGGA